MAVHPSADFHPLLRRQLLDGIFNFGERTHGKMLAVIAWQGKRTAPACGDYCHGIHFSPRAGRFQLRASRMVM